MSERGIQIEGNVFCSVCECYMSQEIICNRKNAETQDPRLFCGQDVTVQPCGGFYAAAPRERCANLAVRETGEHFFELCEKKCYIRRPNKSENVSRDRGDPHG